MSEKMTGEDYIGTFNTLAIDDIDNIKSAAAQLIDLIQNTNSIDARRKEIACTSIETGVMFGIKAIFT